MELPDGPTTFLMGVGALDPLAATNEIVAAFQGALDRCTRIADADLSIVDLHAELVPDDELDAELVTSAGS